MTAKQHAAKMAEQKKWLAQGANPDDELNNAVVAEDVDRVAYLLQHGAHVNSHDGGGFTPLISATRSGFVAVATYLADHKADPNLTDLSGWTPLMWAAWGDDPTLVKMLLPHGAKLDATDKDGLTPLGIAAQNGKVKATRALIASRRRRQRAGGKGRLHAADAGLDIGLERARGSLIEHGAKVNATNPGGVTAIDDRRRRPPFQHCGFAAEIRC